MEKRKLIIVAGMVVLAGFMFVQVRKLGTPAPAEVVATVTPEPIEMANILVTNQPIFIGSRITQDVIEWREWPRDALSDSFIEQDARPNALEELVGSIVRTEMIEGEPFNERKVVKGGDRSVMAALLSPGMRAVSVRISTETAASGFINPGDRVDILLTNILQSQALNTSSGESYTSQTIFENVPVLAIDQQYTQGPDGLPAIIGSVALLQLSPDDAEILATAQRSGEISLTLRGMIGARAKNARSAAKVSLNKEAEVQQMTINRGGVQEQVSLRAQ